MSLCVGIIFFYKAFSLDLDFHDCLYNRETFPNTVAIRGCGDGV